MAASGKPKSQGALKEAFYSIALLAGMGYVRLVYVLDDALQAKKLPAFLGKAIHLNANNTTHGGKK